VSTPLEMLQLQSIIHDVSAYLTCGLQNSTDTLEQLERAFDNIKRKLFRELHNIVRKQVFPAPMDEDATESLAVAPGGKDAHSGQGQGEAEWTSEDDLDDAAVVNTGFTQKG
jgi:hypothetical protein